MGEGFASRVAASLLNAIELPELIVSSQEHYEASAIELATNPAKLRVIKDKLERNRLTTALFDAPRFTKHIEESYTQMYKRYHNELLVDHYLYSRLMNWKNLTWTNHPMQYLASISRMY